MSGPRQINVVSIFTWLFIAFGIYLSVQYVPFLIKKNELESMVHEECFTLKRRSAEEVKESLVINAQRELEITLDPEDIFPERHGDRAQIVVYWHFAVEHPFQYVTKHVFKIKESVVYY